MFAYMTNVNQVLKYGAAIVFSTKFNDAVTYFKNNYPGAYQYEVKELTEDLETAGFIYQPKDK